jgi:hypothetical protein
MKTPRLEDSSEWVAQDKRLQELNGRRDLAEKRLQALLSERSEAQGPMRDSERQTRARELTLGHAVDFKGGTSSTQVEADLKAAYEERATFQEAISLQSSAIEHLRDRLSKEICATLRAHHHQLSQRIAKAMKELAAASAEEHDFRKQLEDDGLRVSAWLRPMEFTARPAGRSLIADFTLFERSSGVRLPDIGKSLRKRRANGSRHPRISNRSRGGRRVLGLAPSFHARTRSAARYRSIPASSPAIQRHTG